ncbi:3192_t:CDS:1, partial [Dentiscutata erythropus]
FPMPDCSTRGCILLPDAFIYKGKNYKTCNSCRSVRTTNQSDLETFVETILINEVSDYIANTTDNLENHTKLSLTFHIRLDKITLSGVGTNVKLMAKLIIDEIEEGDSYSWMYV